MMYIAHLSDIHIKDNTIDFTVVYEKLHELKPDIIVLTGDVVDSTISFSVDIVYEINTFLVSLSAIAPIVMIPGNHDQCINDSSDFYTTITKNHEILKSPKFNYWNHTGKYEFMDIIWNVIVPYEDTIDYEFSLSPQILLFHEDLTRINVDTFSMYTAVMAGHIHTRQFITNNAAYAGSLFQQNIKESHNNHGFLFWKISDHTIEINEINIPNRKGFLKVEIKDNVDITEYPIPEEVMYYDVYYTNSNLLSDIINKYEIKYNSKPRYIKDKSKEIDINDVQTHIELIIKYLGSDHEHLQEIIELHKKYYNQFSNNVDSTNAKISLISIEFENMYAYETKNIVDFTKPDLSGLIADNSLGKSSFLDIILYALYDAHPRISNKQHIMNRNAKKYYVKLIFEINGVFGEIYKTNNNCTFNYDNKNLTQKTISQTLAIIKSIVGQYNHAISTSFQIQYDFNNFVNMTSNQRKQKIVEIMNLNVFEKIEAKIVKLISEYSEKYKSNTIPYDENTIDILKYQILCLNKLTGFISTNADIEQCPVDIYGQSVQIHEQIVKLTEHRKIILTMLEDNKHLLNNNEDFIKIIDELNNKILTFEPASIRESVLERYNKYNKQYLYKLCRVDKNNDIISQSINLASIILERDHYTTLYDKIIEVKKMAHSANRLHSVINHLMIEMNSLIVKLPSINSVYAKLFQQIKCVNKEELTKTSKTLTLLKLYRQIIKPTNGILSFILNDIKAMIETNVNHLLHNFNMTITINNNYDISFNPHGLDISLSSGYQNFILNIAIKIALCNISRVTVPNILIVDEGFNRCDDDNTKHIITFLKSIKNPNVFIISHIYKLLNYIKYPLTIKNNCIEPVTDFVTVTFTDPVTEPLTELVTDPVTEPLTELVTDPVTEPLTDLVTDPVTEPLTDLVTDPVTDLVTDPVTDLVTEPLTNIFYCTYCKVSMKMSNKQKHLISSKHKKNSYV
jgi:hypothetical protein